MMEFLHPAMWHVALESWQWIHQVAAQCNVIRGSGMAYDWIRRNVRHIGILHLVSISTTSPPSTCHSASVSEILSKIGPPSEEKNDVMSIFKMADLSHLGFYGSNNGFFVKPNYITSYRSTIDTIALNCLVFGKVAFCAFWRQTDRLTDKQTNRWTAPMHEATLAVASGGLKRHVSL